MKHSARFGSDLAAVAHLAFYGVLGWIPVTILVTLLSVGVSLIPALLIGVFPLIAFCFALFANARWEDLRVSGLYGVRIPARRMLRSSRTDWLKIPHTAWLQITDGRNWIGLLYQVIIVALGGVLVWCVGALARFAGFIVASFGTAEPLAIPLVGVAVPAPLTFVIGPLGVVLMLAAFWGLATAHRAISYSMLVPSREEELRRSAAAASHEAAMATERASVASQRRDDAMTAAQIERTRIERDLHDGVQPRLVSVGMTLGMAKAKLESDPAAAAALIEEAHTSTKAAITELRQLARGFHPAVLEDRGLDAALSALAARSHVPVLLDVRVSTRCSKEAEAAMYFAIAEGITNVAKHSGASTCRVTVNERPGGMLWARIEDDGHGGAQRLPGGGIDGIANRVAAAGGTLTLTSPVSGPTTIEVSLPCGC